MTPSSSRNVDNPAVNALSRSVTDLDDVEAAASARMWVVVRLAAGRLVTARVTAPRARAAARLWTTVRRRSARWAMVGPRVARQAADRMP